VIPQPYAPGPDVFLNQANEIEEDEEEADEVMELLNNDLIENLEGPQQAEVNISALSHPMENFLHHEEDADLLMGDEMEHIVELPPQNLNVGMVRIHKTFVGDPILPNRKSFTLGGPSLPTSLWTQFLSTNQNVPKCVIPVPWIYFQLYCSLLSISTVPRAC
jgi:hypothetical protein